MTSKGQWRKVLMLGLVVAFARWAEPQPTQVTNLNTTPNELSSLALGPMLRVGSQVVFGGATTSEAGLWRTDGTEAGTEPLLVFGYNSYCLNRSPEVLGATAERLFLRVEDCSGYPALWTSDGTIAGTQMLRRFSAWSATASLEAKLNPTTGQLFFPGEDGAGREPWVSDGTVAGTHRLKDLLPGRSSNPILFTPSDDLTYFSAQGEGGTTDLWVTDGTEAGTEKLHVFPPVAAGRVLGPMSGFGSKLLFAVSSDNEGAEPWISDGTARGTVPLGLLAPGPQSSIDPALLSFTSFAGGVAFPVTGGNTPGLWLTDGRVAGTRRLLATPAGEFLSLDPRGAQFLAGKMLFGRGSGELWVTDGTPAGTRFLASGFSGLFDVVAGRVLFRGGEDSQGVELWATDGTPAGTSALGDFCAGVCSSQPQGGFRQGSQLILSMFDEEGTRRVFRSDGTSSGTVAIGELEHGEFLVAAALAPNGRLLVLASGALGPDLWQVPPNAGSWSPAFSLGPAEDEGSSMGDSARVNGRLLFWAQGEELGFDHQLYSLSSLEAPPEVLADGFSGGLVAPTVAGPWAYFVDGLPDTLWVTDGTNAGTGVLFESESILCSPAAVGEHAAFFDQVFGASSDLWFSAGTEGTTRLVAEGVGPGQCDHPMAELGGKLYFFGTGGDLWVSDGTPEGTTLVRAFGNAIGFTPSLVAAGDRLYLVVSTGGQAQLWVSDGTPAGTRETNPPEGFRVRPGALTALGNRVVFWAIGGNSPTAADYEPWVSDGTSAGTLLLKDIQAGLGGSVLDQFTSAGNRVYFAADDLAHGRELWATDGTPAGTRMVADLAPGELSSGPQLLTAQGSRLVFSADTPLFGRELWVSDGTATTTSRLTDLQPGSRSSVVNVATFFGDQLLFAGDDGKSGKELWRLPAPGVLDSCTPPQDLCLHGGRIRVRVSWRDPRSGNSGVGTAIPFSTQSGFFWFFNPANVELVVKVLDGGPVNEHWWTFYGALSDVEYWVEVTDLETGTTETYRNPPRNLCGLGDTSSLPKAFPAEGTPVANPLAAEWLAPEPLMSPRGSCVETDQNLCLLGGRFAVTVDWRNPRTGEAGQAGSIPGGDQSGSFWFFNPGNIELVVKMLDGRLVNGHYWLFYGGLSDVEYTLHVTESGSGFAKTYENTFRSICGVGDTTAFFGQ